MQERFGFRQIENRNGVLLWNGVPIKCTGTCRHEEFSPYGHALTEDCWKTDIALMKAANINAIRTSHYNHSARFLELCDEAGFYVLDEVPFCWVADDPVVSLKNTNAVWAFILRSKETLARDKNRPCVMAWSIGNESGYGPNAQSAFDYMKANDPTRPAFISQQNLGKNPRTDFEDFHYPPIPELRSLATNSNRLKIPAILYRATAHFLRARGDGLRLRQPGFLGPGAGQHLGCRLAGERNHRFLDLGMAGPGHGRQISRPQRRGPGDRHEG